MLVDVLPVYGLLTAAAGAGFLPFAHALSVLQNVGTVLGLFVIGLFTLLTGLGIHTRRATAPRVHLSAPPLDTPDADPAARAANTARSMRQLLAALPLDLLCDEWSDLHRHPTAHCVALPYRQLLLDELQRRDPVGFDRWRRCAAHSPPSKHLRTDRDVSA